MHEEINQKVMFLCVRSAKMSATEHEKVLTQTRGLGMIAFDAAVVV